MTGFIGTIKLNPANDTWVRSVIVDGGKKTITGSVARTYVEKKQISSKADTHIRSRNVSFEADGFRPVTRLYPFFDLSSNIDLLPKIIEISMVSGIFTKGETIEATKDGKKVAVFRIAQPDHKTGDINSPSKTFNANPFNTSTSLGQDYSASSTVLNVDINSLTDEAQGKYYGYIPSSGNVTLLGQTSKAQATVSSVKLVADTFGDVFGSFFFRDPLTDPPPSIKFKTGTSTFKLTSSPSNEDPDFGSALISLGTAEYVTSGKVNTIKSTSVTVRVPPPIYYSRYGGGGNKMVTTRRFSWDGRLQRMSISTYRANLRKFGGNNQKNGGADGSFGTGIPSNPKGFSGYSRKSSGNSGGSGGSGGSGASGGSG